MTETIMEPLEISARQSKKHQHLLIKKYYGKKGWSRYDKENYCTTCKIWTAKTITKCPICHMPLRRSGRSSIRKYKYRARVDTIQEEMKEREMIKQ